MHGKAVRQANRDAYVEALRDGRKERADTFRDRKRHADRNACRKNKGKERYE